MGTFIGIDLGTTYSAVATIDETGRPVIVHNKQGDNITPSCITFHENGIQEVGKDARKAWGIDPHTVARFKRDMGTSKRFRARGIDLTPTQLSAIVLKKLASEAAIGLGPIDEVVVTIPANFSHEAREATMSAAKSAGLNVRYIINEPTAAALFYAFKGGNELSGTYAVYDLGGGTFDVSVIKVVGQDVEVLASNGVARLGGDDFDTALQKIVQRRFADAAGEELQPEDFTRGDAEEEKKSLSKRDRVAIRVNRRIIEVTRIELEEAISSLIMQAEMLCESTVDEAGITVRDIDGVFLVGGSTRMPSVQASVKRAFGQEPISTANPDEVVALGAALYAAFKGDRSRLTTVQRNAISSIKVSESTSKCFGTLSLVSDEDRGQVVKENTVLIRKGEKIPCSVTESFYTVYDGQEAVNCEVTESISAETDPRFVKVIWEGQLPLPSGRPKHQEIKVSFSYDENQIMHCSFLDVATGRQKNVELTMAAAGASGDSGIDKFLVE